MSLSVALARIAELNSLMAGTTVAPAPAPAQASSAPSDASFDSVLQSAMSSAPVAARATAWPTAPTGGTGARMVALAQREVGQAEMPPGSNDSPRIAEYRTATAGSGVGPWCGYFVSWVARQAGAPLMDGGHGSGSVDAIAAWGQRTGRWLPNTATPQPGDLIVWDEHIGLVEKVLPDGRVQTIEGNASDAVSREVHPRGDMLGFIHVG